MKLLRFAALAMLTVTIFFGKAAADDQIIAPKQERRTPIIIEYEGNDAVGSQLFSTLQKKVKSENPKSPAREARFRILLSTAAEFPARPGVGSVFSATWTFAQSAGTLEYYLVRDLGVVTPETVKDVVDRLMNRTEGVVARYGYLDRAK